MKKYVLIKFRTFRNLGDFEVLIRIDDEKSLNDNLKELSEEHNSDFYMIEKVIAKTANARKMVSFRKDPSLGILWRWKDGSYDGKEFPFGVPRDPRDPNNKRWQFIDVSTDTAALLWFKTK